MNLVCYQVSQLQFTIDPDVSTYLGYWHTGLRDEHIYEWVACEISWLSPHTDYFYTYREKADCILETSLQTDASTTRVIL